MSIRKTFVLSDESVENSYGFTVEHETMKTERFLANPVMLDMHVNDNRAVLGRWLNPRFEGTQFLGETDFDMSDKNVKHVAGKVERDFIKGASLGIIFDPVNLYVTPQGKLRLRNSEVLEATICPVPSNGKSISLYNTKGELLKESEVREMCLSFSKTTQPTIINNNKMSEKINLTAVAIVALASVGVNNAEDVASISKGIEMLNAKLTTANTELQKAKDEKTELEGKVTKQVEANAKAMLSAAKLEGRITAEEETSLLPQAIANYELTAMFVNKMPATKKLGATITTPAGGDADAPKNIDEFEKLSLAKQLAFKTDNPEGYANLFA